MYTEHMDIPAYNERLKTTGRNDPCPCGSGKKYKKCHLDGDEKEKHNELAEAAREREAEPVSEEPGSDNTVRTNETQRNRGKPYPQGKATISQNRNTNIPRRGNI